MLARLGVVAVWLASSSCRAHAPDWGPTSAELQKGRLAERSFVYWSWPNPGARMQPLVVALHGRLGDGAGMEKLSGLSRVAAREKFLLVMPDGVDRSWADARGTSPASKQQVDDVQFLSSLIDLFVTRHGADPGAVYLVGMSNGAMMSLTAACALSEKVAAVVAVTGLVPVKLRESCKPRRPVSVALIVGDLDPLVPFSGGPVAGDRGDLLSAEASVAMWRALDGCTTPAKTTSLPDADPHDGTTASVSRSSGCGDGSEVALFTVKGGGHTWPRGWQYLGERLIGRTSRDFSASEAAWEFFTAQQRAPR